MHRKNTRFIYFVIGGVVSFASLIQAQQVFEHPQVNGVPIDWCLNWAADCGKPAADRFCQNNGFAAAGKFTPAENIGPTKVIGTGQDCTDPRCGGFAMIECLPASSSNNNIRVPNFSKLSGAALFYMEKDLTMSTNFAAKGRSMHFYWNVSKVPNAQGAIWQVSQAPFEIAHIEADSSSPQLAAFGKGSGAQGSFTVDFANIPRAAPGNTRMLAEQPLWFVRVIPISASGLVVGLSSNVIAVYDQKAPSSGPDFKIGGQWYTKPGIQIRMTKFESVPYRYESEWPSGCKHYQGAGSQQTPWGWTAGAVGDAFDWTSQAYQDAQNYVVTGVVTVFPFVPPEAAKIALKGALASCGIPPSIPNLDQMMSNGSDYLANQMVDQLVENEVPAGSEFAQLGKEELRKKIKEQTSQALLETARKIREARAAQSEYCVEMEYPPYLKITIQNASSQIYQDFDIRLDYVDFSVSDKPGVPAYIRKPREGGIFQPFKPFHINRLDPGESLTIPVDLFSQANYGAVPDDPTTSYTEKSISGWNTLYWAAEFSFTVEGGRTIKYRATTENGPHLEQQIVEDGMGFYFKSPKREWREDPFVFP